MDGLINLCSLKLSSPWFSSVIITGENFFLLCSLSRSNAPALECTDGRSRVDYDK